MKILLSPTKKQVISRPFNDIIQEPKFIRKADYLVDIIRKLSKPELKKLLGVSDKLTDESAFKYEIWRNNPDINIGTSAIFTFIGEAFNSLNPEYLTEDDLKYGNDHLLIFSGLYGLLKPFDTIMPYRLDIADRLKLKTHKNLYEFWGAALTDYLSEELEKSSNNLILDVSSKEYSSSIDFSKINGKVIKPDFKTMDNGKLKNVTIYAKRMRGLMAREVIRNRVQSEEELQKLDFEDYKLEDIDNDYYLYIKR